MFKKYAIWLLALLFMSITNAQLNTVTKTIVGGKKQVFIKSASTRTASNPKQCGTDTSMFALYGTSAYRIVTVGAGQSLGQFYSSPQQLKVHGFQFYAYAITPTPARSVKLRIRCNLYKAGADSLPTGSVLASDTITVDTVMGTTVYLNRVERIAKFKTAYSLNHNYIIAIECDSTNVRAGVITNNWASKDGDSTNLACGSVSGIWYRCLNLNISGTTFNCHIQLYPIVSYKFGTDFTQNYTCYPNDTLRFTNNQKNNVSGNIFYNYYVYYNLPQYCHRWNYEPFSEWYMINGKWKYKTKMNYDVRLISTVYQYSTGTPCVDTAIHKVWFKPSPPIISGGGNNLNACIGDSVNIKLLTDAGTTTKWYKKLTDTGAFFIGTAYKIANITSTDSFFVKSINGPCESGFTVIRLFANAYPNKPSIKNDSICKSAVANLSATTNVGVIEWYSAATGGSGLFIGNSIQTPKLNNDTIFYVQANNNGCINKGGRVKVQAFVNNNFAPVYPVVKDTNVCLRPSKNITLKASNSGTDTIRWFANAVGGSPINKGKTFSYLPSARETKTFYLDNWNGVCGSGRIALNVVINDYPTIFGQKDATFCETDSVKSNIVVPWGELNWYDTKNNSTTPAFTGSFPEIGKLKNKKVYYLQTRENSCVMPNWDSMVFNINQYPRPTLVSAPNTCARGAGIMEVKITSGTVSWFEDTITTSAFFTGQKYTVYPLLSSLNYYYQTEKNGCKSPKTNIGLKLLPRPTAGFTWTLKWRNIVTCTPITTTGLSLRWYWGDGTNTSGNVGSHTYASENLYNVMLVATSTSNGCLDTAIIPINVSHVGVKNIGKLSAKIYPNPVSSGNKLFVQSTEQIKQVQLFNSLGKLICTMPVYANYCIIPTSVSSGNYFVKFISNKKLISQAISVLNE